MQNTYCKQCATSANTAEGARTYTLIKGALNAYMHCASPRMMLFERGLTPTIRTSITLKLQPQSLACVELITSCLMGHSGFGRFRSNNDEQQQRQQCQYCTEEERNTYEQNEFHTLSHVCNTLLYVYLVHTCRV